MPFLCNSIIHKKPKKFSYNQLLTATNYFSETTLLGKGSQGSVYLATFNDSLTAAVKITTSSVNSDNELRILSNIRTSRIVNLIGYAVNSHVSPPHLLLVVEYMPNGSLYDLIHKNPNPPELSSRIGFLLQIAKAVRTLHVSDPPIFHRDIKSANILIDDKNHARLSDFGLAIKAHVSDARVKLTPPAGTLGYLDPCYIEPSDLSTKSDVFSFGILLFEVISGRKAIDIEFSPHNIVDWALPMIKSGLYEGVIDRRISKGVVNRTVVRELCLLGARCVRSTVEIRPNVGEIVKCLKKVYRRVKVKRFDVCRSLLRWRGKRSWPLDYDDDHDDHHGNDEIKVEEEVTRGGNRTVRMRIRSKSIGSFREIAKVGPDLSIIDDDLVKGERKGQGRVKMSKLIKSRSMNVLYQGKNEQVKVNEKIEVLALLVNCKENKVVEEQVH